MKTLLRSVWARGLCVLVLGILLVAFSDRVPEWMVMVCGLLFVVPGSVSAISWFRRSPGERLSAFYPVVGLGSILFGLLLIIFPGYFVKALMYLLSAMLLLGGAVQCYTLWDIRRGGIGLHGACFVVPVLTLVAGLFVLLRPLETAALPFVIIGAAFILYALMELWTAFSLWRTNRRAAGTGVKVVDDPGRQSSF